MNKTNKIEFKCPKCYDVLFTVKINEQNGDFVELECLRCSNKISLTEKDIFVKNNDISWDGFYDIEKDKDYFRKILIRLKNDIQYEGLKVLPSKDKIFRIFNECSFENLKVVILGHEPSLNENSVNGLSFSVNPGEVSHSLSNIFKELKTDLNIERNNGDLSDWVKQGVFLLNTTLTIIEDQSSNHRDIGWETFTNQAIKYLTFNKKNIVYILWGNHARNKRNLIDANNNLILEASHPSFLTASEGFFGCKHFSKCNEYLKLHNKKTINW